MHKFGLRFARQFSVHWGREDHAQEAIDSIPLELVTFLKAQNDDFLEGFMNALHIGWGMSIDLLLKEMTQRTGGTISEPRDLLVTRVGAGMEAMTYLAAKQLVKRADARPSDDEKASQSTSESQAELLPTNVPAGEDEG